MGKSPTLSHHFGSGLVRESLEFGMIEFGVAKSRVPMHPTAGPGIDPCPAFAFSLNLGSCYEAERVKMDKRHIDQPEPRWQAVLAFVAVAAIYLALPRSLIVGPIWLLPTLIGVLIVPTVVSHRLGKLKLNRILGFATSSLITAALIASVVLLVHSLPSHKEPPLQLLFSAALLWLTNVIVFALWYWRIDGGGPTRRNQRNDFGSESFLFPQMQIPNEERSQFSCARWRPHFVDYLFIAFTQSSTFGPTDAPLLARWAKILAMIQVFISLSIVVLLISRAVGAL